MNNDMYNEIRLVYFNEEAYINRTKPLDDEWLNLEEKITMLKSLKRTNYSKEQILATINDLEDRKDEIEREEESIFKTYWDIAKKYYYNDHPEIITKIDYTFEEEDL